MFIKALIWLLLKRKSSCIGGAKIKGKTYILWLEEYESPGVKIPAMAKSLGLGIDLQGLEESFGEGGCSY